MEADLDARVAGPLPTLICACCLAMVASEEFNALTSAADKLLKRPARDSWNLSMVSGANDRI